MEIRSLALMLRALAWLGAILILLRPLLGQGDGIEALMVAVSRSVADGQAGPFAQWLLLAMLLPPFLAVAWGLVQLAHFCGRLAQGEAFSRGAANMLTRIGWSVIAAAVLLPASRLLATAYVGSAQPFWQLLAETVRPGTLLSVTMGLIFGMIIIIFSGLLEKSVEIHEENARFI